MCESRDGRSGLPVSNSPYGLCERKATVNSIFSSVPVFCFCFVFSSSSFVVAAALYGLFLFCLLTFCLFACFFLPSFLSSFSHLAVCY